MINSTGQNLEVVILTESGKDWQTFATWYSVWKNLPDATTRILCVRNGETPFQYYQWVKRLKVPHTFLNAVEEDPDLNKLQLLGAVPATNILLVHPLIVAVEPLEELYVAWLNTTEPGIWTDGSVWYCNIEQGERKKLIETHYFSGEPIIKNSPVKLFVEAKEHENVYPLVSIEKGCGKWIHTARGCPFSNAAGLVGESMTVNELRVNELWNKMVPLYSITA
jgi:hypothetical protein